MSLGSFRQDRAGMWHYTADGGKGRLVNDFVVDCLDGIRGRGSPVSGGCWFWFNGTTCPVYFDDNAAALEMRWTEWRHSYQTGAANMLADMQDMRDS